MVYFFFTLTLIIKNIKKFKPDNMRQKEEVFVTNSFEETQKLGEELAIEATLSQKEEALVIALYGDLGAGKTTFTQGLAKRLGIQKRIISPTFIFVRTYNLKSTSQIFKFFYHIDLYRIDGEESIEGLGIEEIIKDQKNIVAIEWAEKIRNLLPKDRWNVTFEYVDGNKRRITIKNGRN